MDDKTQRIKNTLTITVSIVTIFTPFLYLLGMGYSQGWLESLGVKSSFFPQTIEDNLVNAYYLFSRLLLNSFTWVTYIVYGFILMVIIRLIASNSCFNNYQILNNNISTRLSYFLKIIEERARDRFKGKEKILSWYGKFNSSLFYLIILLFTPAFAFLYGHKIGNEKIGSYLEHGCINNDKWSSCVKIINTISENILIEGMLVSYSDDYVAILTNDGSQIIKLTDKHKIVHELLK